MCLEIVLLVSCLGQSFLQFIRKWKRVKNHIEVKVVENRKTMLAFILQKKAKNQSTWTMIVIVKNLHHFRELCYHSYYCLFLTKIFIILAKPFLCKYQLFVKLTAKSDDPNACIAVQSQPGAMCKNDIGYNSQPNKEIAKSLN